MVMQAFNGQAPVLLIALGLIGLWVKFAGIAARNRAAWDASQGQPSGGSGVITWTDGAGEAS